MYFLIESPRFIFYNAQNPLVGYILPTFQKVPPFTLPASLFIEKKKALSLRDGYASLCEIYYYILYSWRQRIGKNCRY